MLEELARQFGGVAGRTNKRFHQSNYSEENCRPVAEWQPARSMRAVVYSSGLWQGVLLRFALGRESRREDNPPDRCPPWFRPREYSSTQRSRLEKPCLHVQSAHSGLVDTFRRRQRCRRWSRI